MTEHEKRMASLRATLNAGVPPAEAAMAYADELASERDALAASLESERREHASLAAAYRLASATKENLKKLREIAETERDALAGKLAEKDARIAELEREVAELKRRHEPTEEIL